MKARGGPLALTSGQGVDSGHIWFHFLSLKVQISERQSCMDVQNYKRQKVLGKFVKMCHIHKKSLY